MNSPQGHGHLLNYAVSIGAIRATMPQGRGHDGHHVRQSHYWRQLSQLSAEDAAKLN
jgi:hypothetical protein